MNLLDYVVLLIVAASFSVGIVKGFVRGAISIASALLGLTLAAHYYHGIAPAFRILTDSEQFQDLLGFMSILVLVVIIGASFTGLIRRGLKQAGLDWTDRIAGGVLGLIRGWLLASALYLGLLVFPVQPGIVQNATLSPYLVEGTKVLVWISAQPVIERFNKAHEELHQFWTRTKGGPQLERNP